MSAFRTIVVVDGSGSIEAPRQTAVRSHKAEELAPLSTRLVTVVA